MSAPVTNGVLRTKLSDMKIGDYIKWYYRNFATGIIGEFSQTPAADQSDEIELKTVYAASSNIGNGKVGGYFYFVKVDQGILLSDRGIQYATSAQTLNKYNALKGSTIRLLTHEEFFKIKNTDLNGNVTPEKWISYDLTLVPKNTYYGTNTILSQDLFVSYRLNPVNGVNENTIGFTSNAAAYNSSAMFVPVMEYVDNSKSTNIFY